MSLAERIGNYDNPKSLGSRLRRRRAYDLRNLIEQVFNAKGAVRILDVGGREVYWSGIFPIEFLAGHRVSVCLVNREHEVIPLNRPDIFSIEQGDGCALRFEDNAFDICHSNSVIEHVGNWQRKVAFAREGARVAPHYFHQTPNFWFPWEPHYGVPLFHWLPEPVKLNIMMRRKLAWTPRAKTVGEGMEALESAVLLTKKMLMHLFPDATIKHEQFLGLNKSFVAIC